MHKNNNGWLKFVKKLNKRSKKVFQIRETEFEPGLHTIEKKHSFKDQSTRKHLPGLHKIDLVVNGIQKAQLKIELI